MSEGFLESKTGNKPGWFTMKLREGFALCPVCLAGPWIPVQPGLRRCAARGWFT